MSDLPCRIAGAPITWGLDPSPDWQLLRDRDRVMSEMVEAWLSPTELGSRADAGPSVRFLEKVETEL